MASTDRDTTRLDGGSGASAIDEEFGLAPLDEDEASVLSGPRKKPETQADPAAADEAVQVPDLSRSLIEEELHDPEAEEIARKVAQRAKFNPLHPPGYSGPRKGAPVGLFLAIGGAVLLLVIVVAVVMAMGL